jgi:UDP-N-acetylglucosamine acyltransferase
MSRVLHDVPPYMLVEGNPARPRCINLVALKRNSFPEEYIDALNEAHRLLYRAKVGLDHAREILRSNGKLIPPVNHLLNFIQEQHEGRHGRARERRRAA